MQLKGSELRITIASFTQSKALVKAIERALKSCKLDLSGLGDDLAPDIKSGERLDLSKIDFTKASGFIETIFNLVLSADSSDEVERCAFDCMTGRTLIGTEAVNQDFFEKPENRELYYPILIEVIKVNAGPFIKGLGLLFPPSLFQRGKSQA